MSTTVRRSRATLDLITEVFLRRGAEHYIGESVTMAQHMYQCAWLAERDRASETLVAACLLHDIGHFVADFREDFLSEDVDRRHEVHGGEVLSGCFPAAVSEPVRLHVAAKRYLCAVEPEYLARLSAASAHSLRLQGGAMTADEAAAFALEPFAEDAVRLRRYDEAGKRADVHAPGFGHWQPLLARVVLPDG